MSCSWRCCWLILAVALGVFTTGGAASACDLCRRLGTTQFHVHAIGGDDHDDALFDSPEMHHNEGEATAQFVLQGGKWPQTSLGDPVTITYSFHNMFDGGLKMPNGDPLPAALIRSSIEEALGVWASVAPLHFVEVDDEGGPVSMANYSDGQFGQIRFKHLFINGPDIPGQPPVAKAQAYFPNSLGNRAGDVFFDDSDPWQEAGTLPEPDILGATIHEVGHTLGLGHTDIPSANMYWIFTRYAGLGTGALHPDDIAGIQAIYGAGVGSVTSLVPEPATCLLIIVAMLASQLRIRQQRAGSSPTPILPSTSFRLYAKVPIRPLR